MFKTEQYIKAHPDKNTVYKHSMATFINNCTAHAQFYVIVYI